MTAIQPFVNLQPFKGTEKENLNEFLRQLASCIQIAGIADNDRHQYLHLLLKGGALTFFDQLPEATRVDYDLAVAALRERYQNDQRVQLQKLIFSARKLKSSEESAQDFLTDLQRLAFEAYPNVVARAAAGGRPAVAAENRALERARRVREAFINGMPIKLRRFLMTQPEDTTIEDLCAKAASRMIVDRLYPEDDDTAFNEVSPASNKELLSGLQALSVAHDTLKQETAKSSEEIRDLNKTIQPTINQLMQQNQNQSQQKTNEQNSQNQNQQQNKPRNYQNWNNQKRNNNWNNRQNNNNCNNNNNGKRNNNWQNGRNNQNNRNAQSSQRHCSHCNKFGLTIAQCWFRPQNRQPPQLPYQQFSNYQPQPSFSQPSFSQPQMTTPMMPQYNPMTQPWSPYYDANMAQNQKN